MDLSEILNVQFHIGGQFIHIGPNLDYVGGEEAMSEIERDKLSLQEVKGYIRDHTELKESMKLSMAWFSLHDDIGSVKMVDYICVGGVADVYVEYHGEEDSNDSISGSDFEDEIMEQSDDELDAVIIVVQPAESDTDVLITDESGVITQRICIPIKKTRGSARQVDVDHEMAGIEGAFFQVLNPTQGAFASASEPQASGHNGKENSDSESDTEYIGHTDDSGDDSEVVELRRHARKFKKRMKESKSWI
ncbi:hypothetical protein VPH35_010137 [Triticum aestivum]